MQPELSVWKSVFIVGTQQNVYTQEQAQQIKRVMENIRTMECLEHIRYRPTGYIRTRDSAGVVHTIRENIDNSVDELTQIPNGKTDVESHLIKYSELLPTRILAEDMIA